MAGRITMIEGSSIDQGTVAAVRAQIVQDERVLVILDSNHLYHHVLAELCAYAPLVGVGGYIVSTDGIMQQVVGAPRSAPDWVTNNPQEAARDFVKENQDFVIEEPEWLFNEGLVRERVTYWPGCYVKRVR